MAEHQIFSSSSPKVATCFVFLILALNSVLGEGGRLRSVREPAEMVFFLLEDLKPGAQMEIFFPPPNDPSTYPRFIPREEADSFPFSSDHLPRILQLFSIPQGSPQAAAMEAALSHCEAKPMEGEAKTCATSQESMLDFARRALGVVDDDDGGLLAMSTTHYRRTLPSTLVLQNYTVLGEPREAVPGWPKLVACHYVPYPYRVFQCHSVSKKNKALLVDLVGVETGDRAVAVAVCHLDTSGWGPDYVAFRVLGVRPGFAGGVCHFFPVDDIVYVPLHSNPAAA